MTDTSDLVERLRDIAGHDWRISHLAHTGDTAKEADTTIEAQAKEIEARDKKIEALEAQVDEALRSCLAERTRAETAERRVAELCANIEAERLLRIALSQDKFDELRRDLDEARAALKPFVDACIHYSGEQGDEHFVDPDAVITVGHLRAARAVIKQGE